MMNDVLTDAATIEVVATGEKFHTKKDWGLVIGNTDVIGEPKAEEIYVDIPGSDGFLDYTEVITGRRIFKEREIKMEVGGKRDKSEWDTFISEIRNAIHGALVKIVFDSDPMFYWTGRAYVNNFKRDRDIGSFEIALPKADPYKYYNIESTEDWLWDPFDFEVGVADDGSQITVNGAKTYTIIHGGMPFVPTIIVHSIGSDGLKMTCSGETYVLTKGINRFAEIVVGTKDVDLRFTGTGQLSVRYRRGSL